MKKNLLILLCVLFSSTYCYADEPDFYYGALGYTIVSATDQTCEVAVGKYSGEVVVPAEVTHSGKVFKVIGVGKESFKSSNIKYLKISDGVQYVREGAVSVCVGLKKLVLPASLVTVEPGCFSFNSIETLIIEDGTEPLHCRLGTYKVKPLEGNENIMTMSVGRDVDKEFFTGGCNKVRDLIIGDMVTTFEPTSFPALRKLTVGSSLQYLPFLETGDNVSSITVKTLTPQSAGGFNKHTYMYATLKVPIGSLDAYKNTEPWNNFYDIEEYDTTGMNTISKEKKSDVYDLHGKLLYKNVSDTNNLPKGIYIINNKKVVK